MKKVYADKNQLTVQCRVAVWAPKVFNMGNFTKLQPSYLANRHSIRKISIFIPVTKL